MTQLVDVTITAPDADWLRNHCATLVEQRLAASANIIPTIESVYRWHGEIHQATEAYAILHTTGDCVPQIIRLTNDAHPYDIVHVLAKNIDQADDDYRTWLLANTSPAVST